MVLDRAFTTASKIISPVTALVGAALRAGPSGVSGRCIEIDERRVHITVRGIHKPGREDTIREIEEQLLDRDGVLDVEVNAVLGRAVVTHDAEQVSADELADLVAELEREHELASADSAPGSHHYPGNVVPGLREVAALGTNLIGLGYSVAGWVLPSRALPPLLPALLSLADNTPRARAELESRIGRSTVDSVFALGTAASQALAQRPVGLLTDVCYRYCLSREVGARHQAWLRWERDLAERPGSHRADPVERADRPEPLPDGPIEQLANRSALLALAGGAGTAALSGSGDRGLGILQAGVPRAAKLGREGFAAQVDRDLCAGDNVVLDPDALRRLDRIDTVVLDSDALLTGNRVVDEVLPVNDNTDVDVVELFQRAHDLVDVRRPTTRRERDNWAVVPVSEVAQELSEDAEEIARKLATNNATVLALLHGGSPVGLASVVPELEPLADSLVRAARQAGSVLVAGKRHRLDRRLDVDGTVSGGTHLAGSVRTLQAQGHVVAVLSGRGGAALAAADVGIGLLHHKNSVPWGAHVQCQAHAPACTLLEAVAPARLTSRRSAQIAMAGSSLAAMLAALGPAQGAATRASFPVQGAALLALGYGTWVGMSPSQRSRPVPVEYTPWHAMSPRSVLERLASSGDGLAEDEAERRRGEYPDSRDNERLGLLRATLDELANPLTPALAAGAGISASVGQIADALMITGVVGVNALIGGVQQVKTNQALRQLVDTSALPVRLRRNGQCVSTVADRLAPGDVVELDAGDAVPADCRVLEAEGLEVDESSLTGESQLVPKQVAATTARTVADRQSMLYQGTVVAAGQAVAVVVATGERTEIGRTAEIGDDATSGGGVEARLRALTKQTLPVCIGAGAALMGVDLLRGNPIRAVLGRAVSLSVAAVPEGLPFVATVAELAAARRLSRRGALARKPSTIEALGRVEVLCFDKTGTLTEGRLSLRQVSDGSGSFPLDGMDPWLRQIVAAGMRASPWHETGPLPHPTDRAVLDGAREAGVTPDEGVDALDRVDDLRFEPSRGYHAVLARCPAGQRMSIKGAPEAVLPHCTYWRRRDGDVPFDADALQQIESEVDRLARAGFRVLAIAERTASQRTDLDEERIRDLHFYGLLALADPVRPTATESVDTLQRAGVEIVMITGDHPSTAEAIAAELRVLNGRKVVIGPELETMTDDELTAELPKVAVFARMSPAQKARVVGLLRDAGRVVAVTGDGANDAPAIRLADVGLALGSHATQAAREAADLVITDDRIETITDAIVEGRSMWLSVRDALSILLGGNLGEIAFTVGAGLLGGADALNTRQLMLVNLLTDVLPSMAVAVRPPPNVTPEELLAEGPDSSLGSALTRDIYTRAATTAGSATAAWMLARPVGTAGQASTTGLVALVAAQLGQTMVVRGRTPLVIASSVGSLVALATVVQVPVVSRIFGCSPLLPHQWALALGSAATATAATVTWQLVSRDRPTSQPVATLPDPCEG